MKGSFFANIVVLLGIRVGTVLEQNLHQVRILVHDGDVQGCAPIDISAVHIGFLVYINEIPLSSKFTASMALEWPTAWNKRLFPGN